MTGDPLDRVIRQLEAERYAGGGWRKVPIRVAPLEATDTPEACAARRAALDAECAGWDAREAARPKRRYTSCRKAS